MPLSLDDWLVLFVVSFVKIGIPRIEMVRSSDKKARAFRRVPSPSKSYSNVLLLDSFFINNYIFSIIHFLLEILIFYFLFGLFRISLFSYFRDNVQVITNLFF